jgi:transcriptional regulator with XRE-family HTH domain
MDIMTALNPAKVIRRVRQRLDLSQEGLSRLLNATKGAVQHWERGRNNPDLARVLALRQLCPPSAERKELDGLIRQVQAQVAPLTPGEPLAAKPGGKGARAALLVPGYPKEGLELLRRENLRFRRQVTRLETTLQRRTEELHILQDLVRELEREKALLRVGAGGKEPPPSAPSPA